MGQPAAPYTSDVMMAPIVSQLDDDDCDGRITSQDRPDIVVVSFESGAYNDLGTTRAPLGGERPTAAEVGAPRRDLRE